MEDNKIEEFMKKITEGYKTICFEDNKKGIKYPITKDNNGKYTVETISTRNIESNDNIDSLFDEMNKYFDSSNEEDFWPKESEYPDMYILWKSYKSDDEETRKSGALKYPDGWDSVLDKIKNI